MAWTLSHSYGIEAHAGSLINIIKTQLLAIGWIHHSSGDGNSSFVTGPTPDVFDGNNDRSWICLQQPSGGTAPYSGTRQIVLQRGNGGSTTDARVVYSPGGTADNSYSANVVPTFSDERIVQGGGTPASPTFTSMIHYGSNNAVHVLVGGAAENFAWVCLSTTAVNAEPSVFGFDACLGRNPSDTDPFVFLGYGGGGFSYWDPSHETHGFHRQFANFPSGFQLVSLYGVFPQNNSQSQLSGNAFDSNKDIAYRPTWMRHNTGGGYKGKSILFRVNHNTTRTPGTQYNVLTTGDRIELATGPSASIVLAHWDNGAYY